MRALIPLVVCVMFAATAMQAAVINFDDGEAGAAPAGWTAAVTGKGETRWTVVKDATAPSPPNVCKQSAKGTFPICLRNDSKLKDGFVEVKFKAVSGETDQAGGVIWRAQDKDNYYIARANVLEDNVTIYHTIQGKRVSFKNFETKVAPGQWHTLRVDFIGDRFSVAFDGKEVIAATDNKIKDAGRVGLWTKADSVTLFDDFNCGAK
jgi:hypothetical protein